jgi:hypothetical protein
MQVVVELVLHLEKAAVDLVDLAVVDLVVMVQDQLVQEQELLEQPTLVVVGVVVIVDLLEQLQVEQVVAES